MNATFWLVIEMIGFSLSGILLVLNVILFIRLRIPILVSELSGKKFEKEVKLIRASNENRSKRTVERRQTFKKQYGEANPLEKMGQRARETDEDLNTDILSYDLTETVVLSNQTTVLHDSGATTVLNSRQVFQIVRDIVLIQTEERIV